MYTINPKATTKITKQRVVDNQLTNGIIKTINPKGHKKRKMRKKQMGQIENNEQDNRFKGNYINKHIKHKWSKYSK